MISRLVVAALGVSSTAAQAPIGVADSSTAVDDTPEVVTGPGGNKIPTMKQYKLSSYDNAKTMHGKAASYYFAKNTEPPTHPVWVLAIEPCPIWDAERNTDDSSHCSAQQRTYCDGVTESSFPLTEDTGLQYFMYDSKGAHVAKSSCEGGDMYFGNTVYKGKDFYGESIIKAVVQDLVYEHGMGKSGKPEMFVLYGGSSGAVAAQHHLDKIESYLEGTGVSENMHIVGLLDSGMPLKPCAGLSSSSEKASCESLLLDGESEASAPYTFGYIDGFDTAYQHYGVSFAGDSCSGSVSTSEDCMFGEYHLPHVTKPFMIYGQVNDMGLAEQAFQPDKQTDWSKKYTIKSNKCTGGFCDSLEKMGTYINKTYHNLDIKKAGNAMFLASCYAHGVTNKLEFKEMKAAGVTMETATDYYLFRGNGKNWLEGPAKSKSASYIQWVDTCSGFSCGSGCTSDCTGVCAEESKKAAKAKKVGEGKGGDLKAKGSGQAELGEPSL